MVGDEVKLLEVTQDVAECFKVGDTLTIRGDDIENAVICSKEKTFEIKEAETSNKNKKSNIIRAKLSDILQNVC